MTGDIQERRYPAPIKGGYWTMSAVDVCVVALSMALSRHVPGYTGAEEEQLERVARAVIEALERPHTRSSLITG